MGFIGNILWLIFGGLTSAISWVGIGLIWCITIVGIPVGIQCFKIAGLSLLPFGRNVVDDGGVGSFFLNILWFFLGGFVLFLEHLFWTVVLSITIIGIPFGQQQWKLAKLSLSPFGKTVL